MYVSSKIYEINRYVYYLVSISMNYLSLFSKLFATHKNPIIFQRIGEFPSMTSESNFSMNLFTYKHT